MQETALDKKQLRALSRIPFLTDFPYPEFTFYHHVMQTKSSITGEEIGTPVDSIIFKHELHGDPMINVLEREIWHLYNVRDNVSKFNQISEQVSKALESNCLLEKSSAVRAAEIWFNEIEGKNFQIGAGTFSDILASFVGRDLNEVEEISTILTKFDDGTSIVVLNKEQKEILLKYLNFQLVYFKLLIGIILAAKIAL